MSKQEIRELLEKARRRLHAAERLSQDLEGLGHGF